MDMNIDKNILNKNLFFIDTECRGYIIKNNVDYMKTYNGEVYKTFERMETKDFKIYEMYSYVYKININVEGEYEIEKVKEVSNLADFIDCIDDIDMIVGYNVLFDVYAILCNIYHKDVHNKLDIINELKSKTVIDLQKYSPRYNEKNNYYLSLKDYYKIVVNEPLINSKLHTAKYDCYITFKLFLQLFINNSEEDYFFTKIRLYN